MAGIKMSNHESNLAHLSKNATWRMGKAQGIKMIFSLEALTIKHNEVTSKDCALGNPCAWVASNRLEASSDGYK
ncbi:hypothetical protein Tco_1066912 [Tanacetum coccineum]|uniref:Uncharacterized protein n=1 Tax=Tanacetum coccineum TaxID=301880 RepID=A0ABQ5HBY8_9ASTR